MANTVASAVARVAARVGPAAQPQRINRMTLESISVGKARGPLRILIYGVEGIGKSSTGAGAPSPVFLGPEDGLENLLHVQRFEELQCWQDVLDAVQALIDNPSPFKTLVLDTVDWLEPLLWDHVCKAETPAKMSIEDFGFGKGFVKALDGWRSLLAMFEQLRRVRGMHIVLLAHSHVKTWKNPEGEDFDRYTLKLHDKAAGLLKEWVAVVAFANYETFADKDKRTQKVKGISTGERWLFTERTAAYDAKNRFNLPAKIPLGWDDLEAAIREGELASPNALSQDIESNLALLGDEDASTRAREAVVKAANDPTKLQRINDHIKTMLAAQRAAKGE